MVASTPSSDAVLASVGELAPPGTPLTTPEVAAEFDCTDRTIYSRLEALAEAGRLETKKVGARGRVWWRPAEGAADRSGTDCEQVADRSGTAREQVANRDPAADRNSAPNRGTPGATSTGAAPVDEESLHRTLSRSIDEGVVLVDVVLDDGAAVDVLYRAADDAARRLTGVDLEGRWLTEIEPSFESRLLERYERVVETGEPEHLDLYVESRGRWYDLYAFQPSDGESRQVLLLIRDITDRKETEQRLEEERDMFAEGPTIVFRWNPDAGAGWPVEYVSANVEEALGYPPAALESGEIPYTDLLLDEELDRIAREVQEATESGAERFSHEPYRIRTREGEIRWVKDVTKIVRDDDGGVEHYLGYLVDVTERVRREERSEFVVELNDALQPLREPEAIMATAAELLGSHLDVDRAGYGEIDADQRHVDLRIEWVDDGVAAASDRIPTDRFPWTLEQARDGRTWVIEDVRAADDVPESERDRYRGLGFRSGVGVPLVKEGTWTVVLFVADSAVREWTETEVELVEDVAERTWAAVERARAETELERANDALERLNGASRTLMEAGVTEVEERAAEIVRTVLGVEYAALWRYDGTEGELRRRAVDTASGTAPEEIPIPDGIDDRAWTCFIGGETGRLERSGSVGPSHGSVSAPESEAPPSHEWVLVPLGRHGVVCAGSTRAVDAGHLELAETTAATVEAAWDHAEGERRLEERNEELQRLDRVNGLIRGIHEVLVDADSRDEIDRAVCGRLAASDQYEFAWIGERNPVDDAIVPREWAGVDDGYLDGLDIGDASSSDDPVAAAARTGELQVVTDVATDPRVVEWREATLERGARSCVAIPLSYGGSLYGVLTVYVDHPQPDERDHAVLVELGETIAHAIDAVQTKRTLLTDRVVELTLEVPSPGDLVADLAREADCRIEVDGVVPTQDGSTRLFFRTCGVPVADIRSTTDCLPGILELRTISEGETCAFEATITDPTFAAAVVDNRGLVRSMTATGDGTTAVVDLPGTASVREFVEGVRSEFPDVELVARSSRDRPIATRRNLQDALEERLTDRQREVLETAYLSGFFESPRSRTGAELAESLGVSQSTLTYHLRAAQRELCGMAFENA